MGRYQHTRTAKENKAAEDEGLFNQFVDVLQILDPAHNIPTVLRHINANKLIQPEVLTKIDGPLLDGIHSESRFCRTKVSCTTSTEGGTPRSLKAGCSLAVLGWTDPMLKSSPILKSSPMLKNALTPKNAPMPNLGRKIRSCSTPNWASIRFSQRRCFEEKYCQHIERGDNGPGIDWPSMSIKNIDFQAKGSSPQNTRLGHNE